VVNSFPGVDEDMATPKPYPVRVPTKHANHLGCVLISPLTPEVYNA